MRKKRLCINILILIVVSTQLFAQGNRGGKRFLTPTDYERAFELRDKATRLLYNSAENITWIDDTHKFWYYKNTKEIKQFILVDVDKKLKRTAFDHPLLAEALSVATGEHFSPAALPFTMITFQDKMKQLMFVLDGYEWTCDLTLYTVKKGNKAAPRWQRNGEGNRERDRAVSPDSAWTAFIRDFNVYIRSQKDSIEHQLSYDGIEGFAYDAGFYWSPDSKKLVTNRVRPGFKRLVHYIESSPDDQLQPKHTTRNYPKPGDEITVLKPHLFSIELKKQIPLDDALYRTPYHIRRIEWRKDSRAFTFEYNQRGHQVYRIIEVNSGDGSVRALVDEESSTFFCYYSKLYRYHLNDGKDIIWMSERDGWNHLYLYNGKTGRVRNQITRGEWVVRSVVHVDEKRRKIYFRGSGREAGQDPYLQHLYVVNFNGTDLRRLTEGNANHEIIFSEDNRYFTDKASRVDYPPVTVVRNVADGRAVMDLERADVSDLLDLGWKMPEVFKAKGRDGKTDIWGMILRPTDFDPDKKYPVIEYIYAGPHSSFVPKSFWAYYNMHAIAELGFIVVQIDGMGTSNRSKAFHDVCYKNLKDAGFPDRILWHKAVAEKYGFYDISGGVGIYGHSAGGQNSTGALLFHPEFYSVAVSSCGCHDNRMDKISWNEQWMGYPIGPHYGESSNVDNAHLLQGKLFLIVGEMDTNVDPASTLQVADALIKANKDFDYLVLPGAGHSIGGKYGERRRMDYFVEHLMGGTPPDWNKE